MLASFHGLDGLFSVKLDRCANHDNIHRRIGNKIIVVKPHEVRYNGHLAERPRVVNGVLLFSVQEAQFSITSTHGNELGTWFNDANDTGGTIGR